MIAVKRPVAKSTVTPSSARTSASPLPYTLTASTARAATGVECVGPARDGAEGEGHRGFLSVVSPRSRSARARCAHRRPRVVGPSAVRRCTSGRPVAAPVGPGVHPGMYAGSSRGPMRTGDRVVRVRTSREPAIRAGAALRRASASSTRGSSTRSSPPSSVIGARDRARRRRRAVPRAARRRASSVLAGRRALPYYFARRRAPVAVLIVNVVGARAS